MARASTEQIPKAIIKGPPRSKKLKLTNIVSEEGDGFLGWPKLAPFDHIIITCAIKELDGRLLDQIRYNGICIAPVGDLNSGQRLKKITVKKNRSDDIWEDLGPVSFVPLISDKD